MCFVIFLAVGAFAVALWTHGNSVYAVVAGGASLVFFFFFIRKLIIKAPCLFGKRKQC